MMLFLLKPTIFIYFQEEFIHKMLPTLREQQSHNVCVGKFPTQSASHLWRNTTHIACFFLFLSYLDNVQIKIRCFYHWSLAKMPASRDLVIYDVSMQPVRVDDSNENCCAHEAHQVLQATCLMSSTTTVISSAVDKP